jgi:muramoyltetrapeptide carboxypeptidase
MMQGKWGDCVPLRRGDAVGVVAPGFAVKSTRLRRGLGRLRKMGFEPRLGDHVTSSLGYLAGDDDARLEDLQSMIDDPAVRAIWFARGGYGTARLLDRFPWRALRRRPKLLIGYSDLTALFGAAVDRTGAACIYGPVVTELGDTDSYHTPSLRALLAGRPFRIPFKSRQVLAAGKTRGSLCGGNLSTLAHLCGTRFFPDVRGKVLFLEETGEQVYRIDRMLTQLRLAGALRGARAILLGGFHAPTRTKFPADRPLSDVLEELLLPLGVPVVHGLPAGHVRAKRSLPLGARTVVDTRAGQIRFEP